MNLYQKLIEIRKEVVYIQKSAEVVYAQKTPKGHQFLYATESQILQAIRPKMDELGVFLEMEMLALDAIVCKVMRSGGTVEIGGIKAPFKFTWVNAENPAERIEKQIFVQDEGVDIQTVGGLMTYASRYFLYKFFSIPTDKDDPDANAHRNKKKGLMEDAGTLSQFQVAQIRGRANEERIKGICKRYKVDLLEQVEAKNFDYIMNILNSTTVNQ